MLERAWKRGNLVKLVRIWQPSRKIMRKLEWILLKEKMGMNTEANYDLFSFWKAI